MSIFLGDFSGHKRSNLCRGLCIATISRPAPLLVDAEHHLPGLPASIPLLQTLNMNIFTHIRMCRWNPNALARDIWRPWLVPPPPPSAMYVGYWNRAILVRSLPRFLVLFLLLPRPLPPFTPLSRPTSVLYTRPPHVLISSLALPAARIFPRIKKQEHIVLCHPQHKNTTPEAPHDHTPRQTGNPVSLTPSLIHTIHTRQHTQTPVHFHPYSQHAAHTRTSTPSPPRPPPPSPGQSPPRATRTRLSQPLHPTHH
ncbi:hypothetical protein B0H13DRAFT_2334908 [Mycena leptocephala]|nr:hypothetical protein B0H13DRAFT_2334908 [Mycena leptocephala]